MSAVAKRIIIAPEDQARADFYDFLGHLLAAPLGPALLGQMAGLKHDSSPIGAALGALAGSAEKATADAVEREFHALFIGLGRGELLPYASFYLTGFLHEKPLAALRREMAGHGIARARGSPQPEDHIASLMEMMGGMIMGRFAAPVPLAAQKRFFEAHIDTWAPHFFSDLAAVENATFYPAVGALGSAFMAVERDAFRMLADAVGENA